jgi:glycosyltransferase involved in cell wall biosynthesis
MKRLTPGVRRLARGLGRRLLSAPRDLALGAYVLWPRRKTITAMVRVRNEEEYLEPCVRSILDLVDRVVIVDNLSDDRTPQIIRALCRAHGDKVVARSYPHAVLRVGKENEQAAAARAGSPNLLTTYYNYCLAECRTNFVLKWDGDMVATGAFAGAVAEFRRSRRLVLEIRGANLHPNGTNVVCGASGRAGAGRDVHDNWTASHTDLEPRLFPRFRARYDTGFSWCERLVSPFLERPRFRQTVRETAYAHLKYCKRDPYANLSPEFAAAVRARLGVGPELEAGVRECVRRWGLVAARASVAEFGEESRA